MCSWGRAKYQYQHQKVLHKKKALNSYYFSDSYFNYFLVSFEAGILGKAHLAYLKYFKFSDIYERYVTYPNIKIHFPKTKKTDGFRMGRGKGYFSKLIFLQQRGHCLCSFIFLFSKNKFVTKIRAGLPVRIIFFGVNGFFMRKHFKLVKNGVLNFGSNF